MNKLFLYLALAGATVFAQDANAQNVNANNKAKSEMHGAQERQRPTFDPAQSAEKVAKQMQQRYGLNDAQTAQVQAANLQFAQGVQALKDKENTSTEALRAQHATTLKGILSAAQYEQFSKEVEQAEKAPKGEPRGERPNRDNANKGQGKGQGEKGNAEKGKAQGKANAADKSKRGEGDKLEGKKFEGKSENFDPANRPLHVYRMLGDRGNGKAQASQQGKANKVEQSDKSGKMK